MKCNKCIYCQNFEYRNVNENKANQSNTKKALRVFQAKEDYKENQNYIIDQTLLSEFSWLTFASALSYYRLQSTVYR